MLEFVLQKIENDTYEYNLYYNFDYKNMGKAIFTKKEIIKYIAPKGQEENSSIYCGFFRNVKDEEGNYKEKGIVAWY